MLSAEPLERDEVKAIRWEIDRPDYRVDFWHRLPPPPGSQTEQMGYKQDAYRISAADGVAAVLAWAEEHAAGRSFVVYVAVADPVNGAGLIRLEGTDPTIPRG